MTSARQNDNWERWLRARAGAWRDYWQLQERCVDPLVDAGAGWVEAAKSATPEGWRSGWELYQAGWLEVGRHLAHAWVKANRRVLEYWEDGTEAGRDLTKETRN